MRLQLVVATVLMVATQSPRAAPLHVTEDLPRLTCMQLKLSPEQQTGLTIVPVRNTPSPTGTIVGSANTPTVVDRPDQVTDGYVRVVNGKGSEAWLPLAMLEPYHSLSYPNARCVPARMSNGLIGIRTTDPTR